MLSTCLNLKVIKKKKKEKREIILFTQLSGSKSLMD